MNNPALVPAVSASFLDALARQDFECLGACFHPAPRARLLTPSALAMPRDAAGVGDRFRLWFGEADVFDVEQTEVCIIGGENGDTGGPCISLRYRIQLREHGGWYTCEQQAYCWAQDGLIERIDLLCSGYQPIPAPVQAER
ncbi:MAG: hypothetical protein U0X20_18400 [Caldilineaceae bacterium]